MSEEENKMMTEETDWTKEPEEATEEAEAEPETAESAPAGVSRKHKKKIGTDQPLSEQDRKNR